MTQYNPVTDDIMKALKHIVETVLRRIIPIN